VDQVGGSDIVRGLVEKAKRVLPGGTFGNFLGKVVIREGRGGRVWDEDGKEYIDFLLGSGPMLVRRCATTAAHYAATPH
jgi:glutamate-1-semialdehyde 2,1-aminomutase